MASFEDIREALAESLAPIPDLNESAYMLVNPVLPSAEVIVAPGSYDAAFARGMDVLNFTIRVMVGTVSDIGSQKRLDRMRASSGVHSIKAAVEADKRLGGLVFDLQVTDFGEDQLYARDGAPPALGCEWSVVVRATGI